MTTSSWPNTAEPLRSASPIAVTRLRPADGPPLLEPVGTDSDCAGALTAETYALFKYGQGSQVPRFSEALVRACLPALGSESVLVTTSGYGAVPPAAAALLDPVLAGLRSHGVEARGFRVRRSTVSPSDYATLNVQARNAALSADQLLPLASPAQLLSCQVLALDDVLVTGVHERAMDQALRRSGAVDIVHAYLVDASGTAARPQAEAELNGGIGSDPVALVRIATQPDFIPNSRFLKAVLRLRPRHGERVLTALPPKLVSWMCAGAADDALDGVPELRDGVGLLNRIAACQ